MKIAHVICVFPPYKAGISNTGFYQAKQLADLGHQVTVFTPDYGRENEDPGKSINFEVERLKPFLKFGRAAFVPQLLWKLKKFDVIHLHYPFFGGHEVVWLGKKLRLIRGKLVIYYHMDFIAPNTFLEMMSLPTKMLYNSLLKTADKILVSSLDYVKELGLKEYFKKRKDKFTEIPLASQFGVKQETETAGLKKTQEKMILFVGGMDQAHRFKGVDVLVKAFASILEKVPQARLVLVGEGELKEEYKALSKELGVRAKIDFTGRILDKELSEYYSLCDVTVLPSVNSGEAFGLVLVEAMAHGKAVIASNLPGVRVVCQDQVNGLLVEPGSVEGLTEALKKILLNDQMRESMGLRGKKMVEEVFNWSRHGKLLEEQYKEVVK